MSNSLNCIKVLYSPVAWMKLVQSTQADGMDLCEVVMAASGNLIIQFAQLTHFKES